MLARIYHLTVAQFRKNPNRVTRASSSLFGLLIKISKSKTVRFVIIIPKRLDKRSTYRNQTKRIITEIINSIIPKMTLKYEIWLQAKKILNRKEKTEVEVQLLKLFKQLNLI